MAKVATMDDLFLEEIRDLYDAEKQLTKALPKMAKAASTDELRKAFEDHLKETQNQVARLEQIFENDRWKRHGKEMCRDDGLDQRGRRSCEWNGRVCVRDAGLIAAAQKVEHYEMSGYGSARTHAQMLGHMQAVSLLEETLTEEKQADRKLNDIAENLVNEEAVNVSAMEEEESARRHASNGRNAGTKTRTSGGSSH
jgi:ferritin-like metal-binding protein YciE